MAQKENSGSNSINKIVKYLFEAGELKRVRRSGWWLIGVGHPESIAEHSFRASVVAYMIGKMENVNAEKAALTVLFHDMPETRINDMHKVCQRYVDSHSAEKKAFNEQLELLPESIKKELLENINYGHGDNSPEGIVAKDADLIECALQAKEYLDCGFRDAQDWLNNIRNIIKTKTAKVMLGEIEKSDSNSWWKGLKKIERG